MSDVKIKMVQDNLEETTSLLKENMEKLLQREEKLSSLQDKTETLNQDSMRFKNQSKRLRRKMWWKNVKLVVIATGIAVICLGVILCVVLI